MIFLKVITNRWFLMAALVATWFFSAAAIANRHQKYKDAKLELEAVQELHAATERALADREKAMADLSTRLSEKKRVVYVTRDDCADTVMADDIRNSFMRFSTSK